MRRRKPSINVLVQDSYTDKSRGDYSLADPLVLHFTGKDKNVRVGLKAISESIDGKRVHPLVQDLYKLALVVYIWDIQTERTAYESRKLFLLMSVSDKEKWDSVKNHLEATLRFLSGDTYELHFVQGKPVRSPFRPARKRRKDCVALFSGGLDSLSGVKWMVDNDIKPFLVSHQGMPLISGVQTELVDLLKLLLGNDLIWHQVRTGPERGKGLTGKEFTQFTRSFMYLSIGVTYALTLGIGREFVFENGVLSLNIPLTESKIFSSTKTVHPKFIMMYQVLLDSLFGRRLVVQNPFLTLTKGEVVKLLDVNGFNDLVGHTISCSEVTNLRWDGVKTGTTRHCGLCYPCIIRRIALHYAGLDGKDAPYNKDVCAEFSLIPEEGKKILLEIADFTRRIDSYSNVEDAFEEFPQFYVDEQIDPDELFDMAKRQTNQFKNFVRDICHTTTKRSLHVK